VAKEESVFMAGISSPGGHFDPLFRTHLRGFLGDKNGLLESYIIITIVGFSVSEKKEVPNLYGTWIAIRELQTVWMN
jgi:hypothetical protein